MKKVAEIAKKFRISEGSVYMAYRLGKVKGEVINGLLFIDLNSFKKYKAKVTRGRKKIQGSNISKMLKEMQSDLRKSGIYLHEFLIECGIERMRYYALLSGKPAREEEIERFKGLYEKMKGRS